MLKKIHSALTLLLCVVLLVHLVITGLLMSNIIEMQFGFIILARVLMCILIAHLVLTFVPMLLNHDGNKKKAYTKLNLKCYVQRISGILIIMLIHPHLKAFAVPKPSSGSPTTAVAPNGSVTMVNLFYLVAMIGLVIFCCIHIAISIPKALVGLGVIVEEKTLARVEKICQVCAFAVGVFVIWASFVIANFSGLFGGSI